MINKFIGLGKFKGLENKSPDLPILLIELDNELIMPVMGSPQSAQYVTRFQAGDMLLIDGYLSKQIIDNKRRTIVISRSIKRHQLGGPSEWR